MAARGRGLFSVYICIKTLKFFLSNSTWPISIFTWQECCFGDPLSRLFKQSWFVKKHDSSGVGLIFTIYLYRNFKNIFVGNHWTNFNITWQKCSFGAFKIQFKPSWCDKNIAAGWGVWGRGGEQGYKIYTKLLEQCWNFNSKYANLFALVSDIGPSWSSCLCNNSDRTWFFNALIFARSRGRCWKPRPKNHVWSLYW